MSSYTIKRIIQMVIVLVIVSVLVFVGMRTARSSRLGLSSSRGAPAPDPPPALPGRSPAALRTLTPAPCASTMRHNVSNAVRIVSIQEGLEACASIPLRRFG